MKTVLKYVLAAFVLGILISMLIEGQSTVSSINIPQSLTVNSPIAASTSTAGNAANINASPAIAGISVAGAAVGGNVNINAGNAARLTSGNANGGNIVLTPGNGIGTGMAGIVVLNTVGGLATGSDSFSVPVVNIVNPANSGSVDLHANIASFGNSVTDATNVQILLNSSSGGQVYVASGGKFGFNSGNGTGSASALNSCDTCFSRAGAGLAATNGAIENKGTLMTLSGCSTGTLSGGSTDGSVTLGNVNGTACTVTMTPNGATGLTAAHGWGCNGWDLTDGITIGPPALFSPSTTTCQIYIPATASSNVVVQLHSWPY